MSPQRLTFTQQEKLEETLEETQRGQNFEETALSPDQTFTQQEKRLGDKKTPQGDERGGHVESLADTVPMETVTETAPIPVNNPTAINYQETTGAGGFAAATRFAVETFQESETVVTNEESETVETIETAQTDSQWEDFTGQELAEGDWLWHGTFGRLTVTLATRSGTVHAVSDEGLNVDLTHSKTNVTHFYRQNRC
ncbi:MAG: hypothetical protein ACKOX2_02175 [Microcystaceae cyanobacterium]